MKYKMTLICLLLTMAGCSNLKFATAPVEPPAKPLVSTMQDSQPQVRFGRDAILRPAADRQARELRRLVNEMRYLIDNLVPQARYYADPDARVRFDWHQLMVDLNRIVAGIEAHLNDSVSSPRFIAPIQGNYGR